MGLVYCQAKYLAEQCAANNISGKIVSFGCLDFFFSFEDFAKMMLELGLAKGTADNMSFLNPKSDKLVKKVIADNKHMNTRFKNKKFVSHPIISYRLFYAALGFHTIDTIDISNRYGNSSIVFDLNQPNIKSVVNEEYDLVLEAGVMEHIFNVPQMFLHVDDLLKTDGHAIYILPGNNTFDHGFYQFCPTLFNDYYKANEYDIKDVSVLYLQKNKAAKPDASYVERWNNYSSQKYDPAEFSKTSFGQLADEICITCSCVQKQPNSKRGVAPTQYLFQDTGEPYPGPW